MALVLLGKMPCSLCGETVREGQLIEALPAFVCNEADPMYPFSDGVFHQDCLRQAPEGGRVHAAVRELSEKSGPGKRTCVVCLDEVRNPDDYILLPRLTGDAEHRAHRFNYTHLHKSHVPNWSDYDDAIIALRSLAPAWRGPTLQRLIDELARAR